MTPITAPTFFTDPRISHGFFTRQGGVSEGLYDSFNCGPGTQDDPAHVIENRRRVTAHLKADHLVSLYQQHTADCYYVNQPLDEAQPRPVGDALVTDTPGLALGVLTADCCPILFSGTKEDDSPVIGAAHAGWGGALKGVQRTTVSKMLEIGAKLESIRAIIGPSIAQVSYEVADDFARPFLIQDDDNERFFMTGKPGHLQFDVPGYNALRLAGVGVHNILLTGEDTYADEARFFSYRRATHHREPDYGRQISAIVINT